MRDFSDIHLKNKSPPRRVQEILRLNVFIYLKFLSEHIICLYMYINERIDVENFIVNSLYD